MEESKGKKNDLGKPPITLIPREALEGMALAFAFGASKYGRYNFRNGIEFTRLLDASLRHTIALADCEDLDPESKLSHAYHALASLAMYCYMMHNKPELDDRWKK